jgi:capsular exopolysaccharide synthesis family protein
MTPSDSTNLSPNEVPNPTLPAVRDPGKPPASGVALETRTRMLPAASPLSGPSTPGQALNAASLLKGITRRWKLALLVGLLLALAGGTASWYVFPAKYTAAAMIRVAGSEPRLLDDNTRVIESEKTSFQKSQVALLRSPKILKAALKNPKVSQLNLVLAQTDAPSWLEGELRAGYIEDTDLLIVSLSGTEPNEITLIVNAVQEAYLQENARQEKAEQLVTLNELEKIVVDSEEKVRRERDTLRGLADLLKTADAQTLTVKQKNTQEELATLKRELGQIQAQIRAAQVKLAVLNTNADANGSAIAEGLVEEALERDPEIQRQALEVRQLEAALGQDSGLFVPGGPATAKREGALKAARETLEKLRSARHDAVTERLKNRRRVDADQVLRQTQEEITVLSHQEEDLKKAVKAKSEEADRLGTTSYDLDAKRAEIDSEETMIKALKVKREQLRVEMQAERRRISLLQAAEVPDKKDTKRQIQTSLLSALAAFCFGVLGVSYWEFRSRRLHTPEEVSAGLGLRVVGTLPLLPDHPASSAAHPPLATHEYWQKVLLESIDAIRSMLPCDHAGKGIQALMITSARGQEGKTMLAGNLSMSIARTGRKTLLVDSDMRRPSLHRALDLAQCPGLSEVLQGQCALADAIQTTEVSNFRFLPAGQCARPAIEALSQDLLPDLFARLREEFDCIVVDSCPVLPVADALLIAKHVDAVILSVRPRLSQAPAVHAACERLRAVGVRILGTVVNGVRVNPSSYDYEYLM